MNAKHLEHQRKAGQPDGSGRPAWAGTRRLLRHLWLDAGDTRRLLGPDLLQRLEQGIGRSEQSHGGEIRLCVEASLPLSYLWRIGRRQGVHEVVRQRALMMFSKLGVWDTEHNTGVLIYVLLAEHAIEIVADRGLRQIQPQAWQVVADELGMAFRSGRHEAGLVQALARCHDLLASTGPAPGGDSNELSDQPHLQ